MDEINIALLIGVSKYEHYDKLKASKNDVRIINGILEKSKKYKDIKMFADEYLPKKKLQEGIINFLDKYKGKKINELFFYFSGHGIGIDGDLLLGTTDTESSTIMQTTISNKFLDNLVREVSPKLYVKFIDACNAGVAYIKGADMDEKFNLPNILSTSIKQKDLNNCIFMSSSHYNQNSMAYQDFSFFTKSLVDIIYQSKVGYNLRYNEVIEKISDYFKEQDRQTPYFITQSTAKEEFIIVDEEIHSYIIKVLGEKVEKTPEEKITLGQQINAWINNMGTENDFKLLMEHINDLVEDYGVNDSIINKFYSKDIELIYNTNNFEGNSDIASWVETNVDKYKLYAEPTYKEIKTESSNPFNITFNRYIYKDELSGYKNNTDLINGLSIILIPKNIGLPKFKLNIIPIYSASKLYLFTNNIEIKESSWEKYKGKIHYDGWKVLAIDIKNEDNIAGKLKSRFKILEEFAVERLKKHIHVTE